MKVTEIRTDKRYTQFKNMLYKRAWAFSNTTGLPFEELHSVCVESFARALNEYDPERGGSFSTVLHIYCTNALIHFCKYEGHEARPTFDWEPGYTPQYDRRINLKQVIGQMSNEAQVVIEILFECPDELLQLTRKNIHKGMNKACHYRAALRGFLQRLHWPEPKITKTINEIRGAVAGL